MKRKKIEVNESILLSTEQQSQIRGGGGSRKRFKLDEGTKLKIIT